ncbi:hypothetical protein KA025_02515 [Candidatus Saccharibacteria bacterium]|nr:hypothetical protein [Candidatus Saccharibacteria bacterium]
MEYGVANEITFIDGVPTRTPIGYVAGIENIKAYNNANVNNGKVIEIYQLTIPEGLNEIIL